MSREDVILMAAVAFLLAAIGFTLWMFQGADAGPAIAGYLIGRG
jgi:nitrate reductase NapE component